MKEKIVQLMKSEGLTPSRLAEILEIQPSGVSHLVSGRNKPGFDLLQKILRRFPNINPYWLMLDDEDMYRRANDKEVALDAHKSAESHPASTPSIDLFSFPTPPTEVPLPVVENSSNTTTQQSSITEQNSPKVKRVILLYDDGSCESFAVK
ncbi:MAG: helix-turn-helix domain-containing protein [Rikenellaceae bacterium]